MPQQFLLARYNFVVDHDASCTSFEMSRGDKREIRVDSWNRHHCCIVFDVGLGDPHQFQRTFLILANPENDHPHVR